jgi:hypothetical protein
VLNITADRIGITDSDIVIELSIVASSDSAGIFEFVVVATDGTNVDSPTAGGCSPGIFVNAIMIARTRLPVFVRAFECTAQHTRGPVTSTNVLFGEDRPANQMQVICPSIPVSGAGFVAPRNNRACIDAQAELRGLRNEILILCGRASATRGRRNFAAGAAAVMFTFAAGSALAGATISGHPIVALVFIIVAAIAATVGTIFSIAGGVQLNTLSHRLAAIDGLRRRYADGAAKLERVCCREFITVPTDAPSCP